MSKKSTDSADTTVATTGIKAAFKDALTSRFFITLTIVCFIEMVIMMVFAFTHVRSGLTIKTHCEIVGRAAIDCTSSDAPWYYIFNFALLPLIVFVTNALVSLKLLDLKGRQLALCWLWLSVLVGLVVVVLGSAMIIHVI